MIAETILILIICAGIFIAFFKNDELLPSIVLILSFIITLFLLSYQLDASYILLVGAIPLGIFISWLSRDEIKFGRRWYFVLIVASVVLGFSFYLMEYKAESLSSFFIALFTLSALYKGYDRRWTKSKI